MCDFFSFCVDIDGKIYYLAGQARKEAELKGENPDSHSYITSVYSNKIQPKIKDTSILLGEDIYSVDDAVWKFELPMSKDDRPEITLDFIAENMCHDGGLPKSLLTVEMLEQIKEKLLQLDWDGIFNPKIEIPSILEDFITNRKNGGFVTKRENVFIFTPVMAELFDASFPYKIIEKSHQQGRHRWIWDNGQKEIQLFCPDFSTEKVILTFSFRKFYITNYKAEKIERERLSIVWRDFVLEGLP